MARRRRTWDMLGKAALTSKLRNPRGLLSAPGRRPARRHSASRAQMCSPNFLPGTNPFWAPWVSLATTRDRWALTAAATALLSEFFKARGRVHSGARVQSTKSAASSPLGRNASKQSLK
eukprot:7996402-Pyramimonas_sp.AAC.1